jgi:hypothetical protein
MNRNTGTTILLVTCVIISINALRSITNSYSTATVYTQRKQQTEIQYIELVKKKNELDYINSPFFIEKQLRESLNYYRSGEKLLVFTENSGASITPVKPTENAQESPLKQWQDLLIDGIIDPFSR